jgi:hypothetical protein
VRRAALRLVERREYVGPREDLEASAAEAGRDVTGQEDPFASSPVFHLLESAWVSGVRRMLAGTAQEWRLVRRVAAGAKPPSPEEYLRHAVDSIAVSPFLIGLWIAEGDERAARVLPVLQRALHEAVYAVRLANDLGSHGREATYGDLNAVMLGMPRAHIVGAIADRTQACTRILQPLLNAPNPAPCAVALDRFVRFTVGMYSGTDFRFIADER